MDPTIQVDEIVMYQIIIFTNFMQEFLPAFYGFCQLIFGRANPSALVNGSAVVKALIFHRPTRLNVLPPHVYRQISPFSAN